MVVQTLKDLQPAVSNYVENDDRLPGRHFAYQTGSRSISILPLVVEGKPLLLCNAAGKLYAIANRCSPNDKPLERGRIGNGWIACPTHGARFDLATGKALCLPATLPVTSYALRVVDEWIEVELAATEPA